MIRSMTTRNKNQVKHDSVSDSLSAADNINEVPTTIFGHSKFFSRSAAMIQTNKTTFVITHSNNYVMINNCPLLPLSISHTWLASRSL